MQNFKRLPSWTITLVFALQFAAHLQAEIECSLSNLQFRDQTIPIGNQITIKGIAEDKRYTFRDFPWINLLATHLNGIPLNSDECLRVIPFGDHKLEAGVEYELKGVLTDGFSEPARTTIAINAFSASITDSIPAPKAGKNDPEFATLASIPMPLIGMVRYRYDYHDSILPPLSMEFMDSPIFLWLPPSKMRTKSPYKFNQLSMIKTAVIEQLPNLIEGNNAYLIRNPEIQPYERDSQPDKSNSRTLYQVPVTKENGVFVLAPEFKYHTGLIGHETLSEFYFWRNAAHIYDLTKFGTPEQMDEVANRLQKAEICPSIKLLYAGILASRNDARGINYISERVKKRESLHPEDHILTENENNNGGVYYIISQLPFYQTKPKATAPWLTDLMLTSLKQAPQTVIYCSDIHRKLAEEQSTEAINLLINYLKEPWAAKGGSSYVRMPQSRILRALFSSGCELSYQQVDRVAKSLDSPQYTSSWIVKALLQTDNPNHIKFVEYELNQNDLTREFRNFSKPSSKILARLNQTNASLSQTAKDNLKIINLLVAKDPVAELIAGALNDDFDPEFRIKIQRELAHRFDQRIPPILNKILKNEFAKKQTTYPQRHLIALIEIFGNYESKEAVALLVDLLKEDFSELNKGMSPENYFENRLSSTLFRMTGEFFGTDIQKWTEWLEDL